MNRDPIREAGGINLYGFVQNNPVNWVDPYGLDAATTTAGRIVFGEAARTTVVSTATRIVAVWVAIFADLVAPASAGHPSDMILPPYHPAEDSEDGDNEGGSGDNGCDDEDYADDIAEHAKKHNPRIPTDDLAELIKDVIRRGEKKDLPRGRRAYWDDLSGRVVIVNPSGPDKGSSFQPKRGRRYFDDL
jgi:uncharacterized protein RhaS with RHS repeats